MTARKIRLRYCFNCRTSLDFTDYMVNIRRENMEGKLKLKIWNSKHIQLFCCLCNRHFRTGKLRIMNRRILQMYSPKIEPEQKEIKDIIRNIDPIDYRTLEEF